MPEAPASDLRALTAQIVTAYVEKNTVTTAELPILIHQIYQALTAVGGPVPAPEVVLTPAVAVKRSVSDDYIICLEDGLRFKSLKRHLRTKYNLTPEEYRAKWGLPKDYPIVARSYALTRSTMAKQTGFGKKTPPAARARRSKTAEVEPV